MSILSRMEELLAGGESFAHAVIVGRSGSAPRAVGARMAVRADGSIIGTVGGGLIEAQVRELAMEVLRAGKPVLRKFSLSAEDADALGMICGGEVEVLVHLVDAFDPANVEIYRQSVSALESREPAWLITQIPGPETGSAGDAFSQALVRGDGTHYGRLDLSAARAITLHAAAGGAQLKSHEGKVFFVEPLGREETVFIFGAGHISRELALLTRLVGFRTVVLDDRSEFASRERFQTADEIIVPDSFERAMEGLEIDEKSYLVLVTRGHVHDKTLLRQALGTGAGYIGMIGSRRKRDAVYSSLGKEGFSQGDFDRVFSPIGLDIGAETPEEIAVSIAAELVRVRAAGRRGPDRLPELR